MRYATAMRRKGIPKNLAAARIRTEHPDLAAIVDSRAWSPIWSRAGRVVSTSPSCRRRIWAERGLTHVLIGSPTLHRRGEPDVLRAVAVLTNAALGWRGIDGQPGTWDTVQLSARRIGTRIGLASPNAGSRTMRLALDAGLVIQTQPSGPASGPIWRLAPLRGHKRSLAREMKAEIDALVNGEVTTATALYRAAQHPAWDGHSDAWLVLLRGSLGRLGTLSPARERTARHWLSETGLDRFLLTADGLDAALDAVADREGTADRRRALMAQREAEREAQLSSLSAARARRSRVHGVLASGPVLTPASSAQEQQAWAAFMTRLWAEAPAEVQRDVRPVAHKRLTRAGFTEAQADRALDRVLASEVGAA